MKKSRLIIVTIVIAAILIAIPVYYTYFSRPVTASSDKLILTEEELPGWTQTFTDYQTKSSLTITGVTDAAHHQFYNSSANPNTTLVILVMTFDSRDAAQSLYHSDEQQGERYYWKGADIGVNNSYINYMLDPNDSSRSLPNLNNYYYLLMDNAVVVVGFQSIYPTDAHSLPGDYTPPSWMTDIVDRQMDKIDSERSHLL